MIREDIIRMAKEARFYVKDNEAYSPSNQEDHELTEHLERFAKLIAEHERNEIIEILDASTGYVHMDAIRERT
jgi:tRNA nucleotidyltransferase/poly(A) polymerase